MDNFCNCNYAIVCVGIFVVVFRDSNRHEKSYKKVQRTKTSFNGALMPKVDIYEKSSKMREAFLSIKMGICLFV